ncbi:MAG TPA: DUF6569 family protein [Candidatus Saccharimonadales bacterium]|jgi:hypothetical protein|nr:DUF6569 family protein [Candidatus Saccharimonadales bacterium]
MKIVMFLGACLSILGMVWSAAPASAYGNDVSDREYKVLAPITHGNLTIFPVVAVKTHDASGFLTLDEGIRSGEVTVTEVGKVIPMVRRTPVRPSGGAQVNSLVLINNSKRPLILLAGEVVTGGKQDRIVGRDRLVPAESDPVDLSVFCVEHGRWAETSSKFDTHANAMAKPSIRKSAMADNSQQKVWDEVGRSNQAVSDQLAYAHRNSPGASNTVEVTGAQMEIATTSSYAKVMENKVVRGQVEAMIEPIQKSFDSVIKQLRDQNAVGVVVAVKGRIIWADIFSSSALLSKYWAKLLPSYAAEALTVPGEQTEVSAKSAQEWVNQWQARHEVTETEPGLYKQTEMTGEKFKAFQLTSLLPKQGFDLHLSKMAE